MNEGLTYKELKQFADLIIKSNMVQLVKMKEEIESETKKRIHRCYIKNEKIVRGVK